MVYFIYPNRDATIYEDRPIQNTGLDSILEIGKLVLGSGSNPVTSSVFASRAILGFDFSKLNDPKNGELKILTDAQGFLEEKLLKLYEEVEILESKAQI